MATLNRVSETHLTIEQACFSKLARLADALTNIVTIAVRRIFGSAHQVLKVNTEIPFCVVLILGRELSCLSRRKFVVCLGLPMALIS